MSATKSFHFVKMHGLGNDFVIINNMDHSVDLDKSTTQHLANRHVGIGFDQLLLIEASHSADFFCRIFNADGSEASQCGNGLRCVARYLNTSGLSVNSHMTIETRAGIFPASIQDDGLVQVNLGIPKVDARPLKINCYSDDQDFFLASLGNQHIITEVKDIQPINPAILYDHPTFAKQFPNGINIGFMEISNPSEIKLRTIERGAGETNACGSNACAAVACGITHYGLANHVRVNLKFGSLKIQWEGPEHPIFITGPAESVFKGEITL